MFIDQPKTPNSAQINPQPTVSKSLLGRKEMLIIGAVAVVILIGVGAWWYYTNYLNKPKTTPIAVEEKKPDTGLPGNLGDGGASIDKTPASEETNLKAENLTFGSFYKPITDTVTINVTGVKLPLNVKSQVSNYYDMARKINLDPILNNLNQNGFGVIDSPFAASSNDSFAIYSELKQRSIPLLLTGDFLTYYYQNSLKQIYKDIEASYFYDNIWRVTNDLYTTANARYQERRQKLGVASDSLLEAERLEAAYFAVGLVLLRPEKEQINSTEDINNIAKFKPSEATRFDFSTPGYLADDLDQEIKLIKAAGQTTKSPVLLYDRNYQDFKIPAEYLVSAKLRNFYLASRWYSSLFPLYFKDKNCPTCLLDKEDWIINQSAAQLIAADLSGSQSLKNDWAKIYKVISFFSGLRSELTYLHYQSVRQDIFKSATLEEVLGLGSYDRLIKLQEALAKLEFRPAEGAYSRETDKPILGMRLLQTAYWPSQSFYSQLTYDPVGSYKLAADGKSNQGSYLTSCNSDNKLYRCRGLGFDILNITLKRLPKSKFILDNINYENYATQVEKIRQQLSSFNTVDWHNNNFWVTLNIAGAYMNEKLSAFPYDSMEQWYERKLSSALASLTNLVLPPDTWQISPDRTTSGLEISGGTASLNYIEPNLKLASELVANTKMLFAALTSLGVVNDKDTNFLDLLNKMESSRSIMLKEVTKETVTAEDYQFITDLLGQFKLETLGNKTATVEFYNPKTKQTQKIKQSVTAPKVILLIYEKDGKKILAAGPIFSYKEQ